MAAALFAAAMCLYTTRNDFPFYYHPDEKGKVLQIKDHTRNCNHPLMMLSASAVVSAFHRGPLTEQEIVERGRGVSAFFTAAGVVALALLAWRMAEATGGPLAGLLGGLCTGIICLLDATVFDLAHFMKEDPALAMGLALTFLALHVFWKRRDDGSVIFAGIATATAVSGKYVGWFVFPFALGILYAGADPAKRPAARKLFLKSFFAAFLVLNYSLIFDPFKPFHSVFRETRGVVVGHHGLTRKVPHADYLRIFLSMPTVVTALFGVYVAGLLARFKKVTPPEWLVLVFSVTLTAMMSFSPKVSLRYFLPVEMAVCFGAGMGLIWLATAVSSFCGRLRPVVLTACALPLLGLAVRDCMPRLVAKYDALGKDDHLILRRWIAQNLPPAAVIAEDDRVRLNRDEARFGDLAKTSCKVLNEGFVADLGTLQEQRAKGITHVAVASAKYILFNKFTPTAKVKNEFEGRKEFYASLGLVNGSSRAPGVREVWRSEIGQNIYLQPGIILFDITEVAPEPAAPQAN